MRDRVDPEVRAKAHPATNPTAARFKYFWLLEFGDDLVFAHLSGIQPTSPPALPSAPCWWVPFPAHPVPDSVAPMCLGAGPEGWLVVDLALAPGTISISGHPHARRRLAAALVDRLCSLTAEGAENLAVVVTGALLPTLSAKPISAPSAREFDPAVLPTTAEICFVFCSTAAAADTGWFGGPTLAGDRSVRIVPVVVGNAVDAQWSFVAFPSSHRIRG